MCSLRQAAPDPTLDPTLDPKRAKRIMANRIAAAKSKARKQQKEMVRGRGGSLGSGRPVGWASCRLVVLVRTGSVPDAL